MFNVIILLSQSLTTPGLCLSQVLNPSHITYYVNTPLKRSPSEFHNFLYSYFNIAIICDSGSSIDHFPSQGIPPKTEMQSLQKLILYSD